MGNPHIPWFWKWNPPNEYYDAGSMLLFNINFYTNHGYTVEISQITDVTSNVAVIHESMDEREKKTSSLTL